MGVGCGWGVGVVEGVWEALGESLGIRVWVGVVAKSIVHPRPHSQLLGLLSNENACCFRRYSRVDWHRPTVSNC